jgi:hypothetical protein
VQGKERIEGDNVSDFVQKICLKQVSLEERCKEAEKPLYILRA